MSSSDVRVSLVEGIESLFRKTRVAECHLVSSSTGGPSGVVPMLASTFEAGSGVRLVEAWRAGSPDIVRRILFLPGHSGHRYILKMTITEHVLNHTSSMAARPCLCLLSFLEAYPAWVPLVGESPRVRHGAPMAFPIKCNTCAVGKA